MSIQESDNLFTIIQTKFLGCFKHILSWDNFYAFAVASTVPKIAKNRFGTDLQSLIVTALFFWSDLLNLFYSLI